MLAVGLPHNAEASHPLSALGARDAILALLDELIAARNGLPQPEPAFRQ
ncbi:hypothetical protein AB0K74_35655 [Streptomyces sp. NPDC056159]